MCQLQPPSQWPWLRRALKLQGQPYSQLQATTTVPCRRQSVFACLAMMLAPRCARAPDFADDVRSLDPAPGDVPYFTHGHALGECGPYAHAYPNVAEEH